MRLTSHSVCRPQAASPEPADLSTSQFWVWTSEAFKGVRPSAEMKGRWAKERDGRLGFDKFRSARSAGSSSDGGAPAQPISVHPPSSNGREGCADGVEPEGTWARGLWGNEFGGARTRDS